MFHVMARCLANHKHTERLNLLARLLDPRLQDGTFPTQENLNALRRWLHPAPPSTPSLRPPPSLLSVQALVFERSGCPLRFLAPWHGQTLQDCLRRGEQGAEMESESQRLRTAWKGASLPVKLQLLAWLASSVQWLHERGILHLDIKPDNMMLRAGPESVLVLRPLQHATEPSPLAEAAGAAPLVLIDFSSAVVCGEPGKAVEGEALSLCFETRAKYNLSTSNGDIQTTPAYDYKSRAGTYTWCWDVYAVVLVAWQVLLWSPGPKSERYDSLRNYLEEASQPYASTAFFKNSPLLRVSELKKRIDGREDKASMASFFRELFPSLEADSLEESFTGSKSCVFSVIRESFTKTILMCF